MHEFRERERETDAIETELFLFFFSLSLSLCVLSPFFFMSWCFAGATGLHFGMRADPSRSWWWWRRLCVCVCLGLLVAVSGENAGDYGAWLEVDPGAFCVHTSGLSFCLSARALACVPQMCSSTSRSAARATESTSIS